MNRIDIEIAVADFFDWRRNLIVPNVSWGLNLHECDLLILSKAGYATEIEIKISKADLIRDKEKIHAHLSPRIKHLYFAMPESLADCSEYIPEHAGIIIVSNNGNGQNKCHVIRDPTPRNFAQPLLPKEREHLAKLGTMRIWNLKRKNRELQCKLNVFELRQLREGYEKLKQRALKQYMRFLQ